MDTVYPTKEAAAAASADRLKGVAMPRASGVVRYGLNVTCPLCEKQLDLNEYPYDGEHEDYAPGEDELGLALFGLEDKPAQWEGLEIKYRCYGCKEFFLLTEIEI